MGVTSCGHGTTATERAAAVRSRQARAAARRAGLPADVQTFVARYARVVGETFTVTYASGTPGEGEVVLAQRPPDKRLDISTTLNGRTVTRSLFVTRTNSYSCLRDQSGTWSCSRTADQPNQLGPLAAADVTRTVDALKQSRTDYDFHIGARPIARVTATCLVTTPRKPAPSAPPPASLCLSPEGAPLLVEGSGQALRAVKYSTRVDGHRFDLPAAPSLSTAGP